MSKKEILPQYYVYERYPGTKGSGPDLLHDALKEGLKMGKLLDRIDELKRTVRDVPSPYKSTVTDIEGNLNGTSFKVSLIVPEATKNEQYSGEHSKHYTSGRRITGTLGEKNMSQAEAEKLYKQLSDHLDYTEKR